MPARAALRGDAWLADLFEPPVRVAASAIDADAADLLPEERACVARAVPARQREFATGRARARTLLAELGAPAVALLRDEDRVPRWPAGVVGSISHTRELCVVALAPAARVAALGVDVEPDEDLEPELWPRVATEAERAWLLAQPEAERGRLARALFSVKECVYKAAFPALRERWGFQEVSVALELAGERFRARTPAAERVTGRLLRRRGFWIAGVAQRVA
jgi:4'-phosphopantetheinyl transferase EntD